MKSKLRILTLVGLVAGTLSVLGQDTTPAAPDSGASVTSTNDAAAPAAAPTTPATPATPEPATPAVPATPDSAAPATPPATPATPDTAKPDSAAPATDASAAPATSTPKAEATDEKPTQLASAAEAGAASADASGSAAASTNSAPQKGAIIPLIVMDDVPLTDAIKNLARQAGLNYMLDPKVSFGQMGPDGHPVPQPTISIRWENVTAEQALTALLTTYNLQLVEDPKSKIARVTVKDPAAPDPLVTHVIQLKYASPSNMLSVVQNTLTDKRSKVVADVRTSQLVVLATEKEMVDVDQLVERLDTRTKQVLIEARLLETQLNPKTQKGIDWTSTLQSQHFNFGNNGFTRAPAGAGPAAPIESSGPAATPGAPPAGLTAFPQLLMNLSAGSVFNPAFAFLNADGVAAALSFLNNYQETKVISAPRTVTLDNEPATIEVGTMFPIVNTTAGTANTTGGAQVNYSNLTVRLDVTPRISANNFVNLKVYPKILRLGDLVTSTVGGFGNSVNEFFTRQMQTTVLIPSGNTLVMGGLIDDNVHTENRKVPVLGDVPGLSFFFRWDSKERVKDNLIVFITPTIVQDEDFQPTTTDFLKTPVPRKDSIEGPWSSWDSGKPRDWSKPQSDPDKFGAMPPASSTDTSRAGATPPSASNNSQKTPASSTAASTTEPDKFAALPPASSTK